LDRERAEWEDDGQVLMPSTAALAENGERDGESELPKYSLRAPPAHVRLDDPSAQSESIALVPDGAVEEEGEDRPPAYE